MLTITTVRLWSLIALLAVLVVGSALAITFTSFQGRVLVAEFQRLQEERNAHHVERGQLLLEQSTWGSFNRIEGVALRKLDMQVPEPEQIVMVSP